MEELQVLEAGTVQFSAEEDWEEIAETSEEGSEETAETTKESNEEEEVFDDAGYEKQESWSGEEVGNAGFFEGDELTG